MRKIISHIRWFFAYIPMGIVAAITAPILYPLAQLIETFLPKHNPLWWYMDDEIENELSNSDWRVFKIDKPNWIRYYLWHGFRNTMWNLKVSIKPKKGRENCVWNNEKIVDLKQDTLICNGRKLNLNDTCLYMAGLKWITKDGEEGWHVFNGEKISNKFSIFGTAELWYEVDGILYYRYSTVKFTKYFVIYFAMGATEKRYLLNFKIYRKAKVFSFINN